MSPEASREGRVIKRGVGEENCVYDGQSVPACYQLTSGDIGQTEMSACPDECRLDLTQEGDAGIHTPVASLMPYSALSSHSRSFPPVVGVSKQHDGVVPPCGCASDRRMTETGST